MKIYVLCIVFFIPTVALSFNWDRCYGRLKKKSNHWVEGSITTTYGTSEFFTSTGDCAMVGNNGHDKKVFIAHNLDHIQSDSARGNGEYLSAYASLSGCSKIGSQKLGNSLQSNFSHVFGDKVEYSPKQAYERIERLILTDPKLSKECKQEG